MHLTPIVIIDLEVVETREREEKNVLKQSRHHFIIPFDVNVNRSKSREFLFNLNYTIKCSKMMQNFLSI